MDESVTDGIKHWRVVRDDVSGARRGGWHERKVRGAVRESALRDASELNAVVHFIKQGEIGVVKAEGFTQQVEAEVDMISALAGVGVGLPFHPLAAADET